MKKNILIIAFLLVSLISAKGNVTILSATTAPASPADTQHVKVMVSSMFSSGGCPLINSTSFILNDTVYLAAFYQPGPLAVICNASDTFDLGMLPCTVRGLSVIVHESGSVTGSDQVALPLSITCTPTGIEKLNPVHDILLYPNPASGELKLKITGEVNSPLRISILNVLGEKISSPVDFPSGKNNEKTINIVSLAQGLYFVKVETENRTLVKKFLKN